MKTRLLFVLNILVVSSLFAGVKTSVTDGNWFDANTWSPSGVPFMEDTVIIDHHVYVNQNEDVGINWLIINANDSLTGDSIFGLHGNLKVDGVMNIRVIGVGDGTTTINNGLIKGSYYTTGNTTYDNQGQIRADTLACSEVPFDNYGMIDNNLVTTSGTFNNYGSIVTSGNLIQSGLFNHLSGAYINAVSQLIISGDFNTLINSVIVTGNLSTSSQLTHDGDISCDNWTHGAGTANGTTGRICIALCFINNSTISGTIDVCDATPAFICDINTGSIAGSVSMCAAGVCNTTVGIGELEGLDEMVIYPNPFDEQFTIEATDIKQIQVFDANGRLVEALTNIQQARARLQLEVNPGLYLVRIIDNQGKIETARILKQ